MAYFFGPPCIFFDVQSEPTVSGDALNVLLTLLAELEQRLEQPLKPRMIIQKPVVDVTALEQKISEMEGVKAEYGDQLQHQLDVIASLKRDLASANARLSDVAGLTVLTLFHLFCTFFSLRATRTSIAQW